MIDLRTHERFPTGGLRAEWDLLVDEDPHATIFSSPRYLELWYRELGRREPARVRTAHRDGRLIGVIPEAHEREGSPTGPVEVIRFLGGTEVTDYRGPISRREDRDDVAAAYLEVLKGDVDWDELVAGGLATDTGWADALERHAEAVGLTILERDSEDVCPRVELPGDYGTYLDALPAKQRHELRRKARKLERDAGEVRLRHVAPADLDDGLRVFFDLVEQGESEKSGFFVDDAMRRFFRALADEFGANGTFRVDLLDVAGMPAAAAVSLVHGGEWGLYNSAFQPELGHLAPGMVLVSELIRVAVEERCRVFDLLRGDEPYKYRFGAEARQLERLSIVRR